MKVRKCTKKSFCSLQTYGGDCTLVGDCDYVVNTTNEKIILNYLKNKSWTSPTEIGQELGKSYTAASSFASRVCKQLVKSGKLERNDKGKYRIATTKIETKKETDMYDFTEDKTQNDELLPCPFCGKQPTLLWQRTYYGFNCCVVHIGFTGNNRKQKAIKAWNTRVNK